ncbi:MAG TPA: MotA/TolQ/ExbB proton channel family protein [Steroidobacteraceae bacterium]|nr:MotA/TolQ/ExbB proton channel family protein [Steroidobacteraceae bacterium]
MNFEIYHKITFDALYACIALALFVIFERALYLAFLSIRARRVRRLIDGAQAGGRAGLEDLATSDPISAAIARYVRLTAQLGTSRAELEDQSSALYIEVDAKVSARLWVLDTIVTAAPLLGLLGTILGIMQTFTSLSKGGISDPGEVSRGIGLALIATAIGIATALLGLLGHNVLERRAHTLTESFKTYLLRLTALPRGAPRTAP